jgi:putative tryptophan/tyrosine transport system substrate-binding protein
MSLHNVTRGIELSIHRVAREEEIAPAVNAAKASDAGAINMLASALFFNNRTIIFDRIATLSLPAVYQWPEWAEEDGLIGFRMHWRLCLRSASSVASLLHTAG